MDPDEEMPGDYVNHLEVQLWEDVAQGYADDEAEARMNLSEEQILAEERAVALTYLVSPTRIPLPTDLRSSPTGQEEEEKEEDDDRLVICDDGPEPTSFEEAVAALSLLVESPSQSAGSPMPEENAEPTPGQTGGEIALPTAETPEEPQATTPTPTPDAETEEQAFTPAPAVMSQAAQQVLSGFLHNPYYRPAPDGAPQVVQNREEVVPDDRWVPIQTWASTTVATTTMEVDEDEWGTTQGRTSSQQRTPRPSTAVAPSRPAGPPEIVEEMQRERARQRERKRPQKVPRVPNPRRQLMPDDYESAVSTPSVAGRQPSQHLLSSFRSARSNAAVPCGTGAVLRPSPRENQATGVSAPTSRRRRARSVIGRGRLFGGLVAVETDPLIDPPRRVCFGCWSPDHMTKNCPAHTIDTFCDNCGRRGVRVTVCPRCSLAYCRYLQSGGAHGLLPIQAFSKGREPEKRAREEAPRVAPNSRRGGANPQGGSSKRARIDGGRPSGTTHVPDGNRCNNTQPSNYSRRGPASMLEILRLTENLPEGLRAEAIRRALEENEALKENAKHDE